MRHWGFQPATDLALPPRERWRSLRRENGLGENLMHLAWFGFTRTFLGCWNHLEVIGRQHLPRQPRFVMVANHNSHLDAPALAATLPLKWCDHVFPIAAGDAFFEKPEVAAFAALVANALPVWRHNRHCAGHAMETLRDRITRQDAIYLLFPEGTRSRNGTMLPFKDGIGALVAGTDVPVVPCHIEGTAQAGPVGAHFPTHHKISVHIGQPLDFLTTANDRAGWASVAKITRQAVAQLAPNTDGHQPDPPEP